MVLNDKQLEGLRIAVARYKNHERYTCISGYAGTGKSTLVKFLIAELNVDPDKVCYTSFTGKAAQVLMKKGNKNAMTLHKLLYESYPKPNGGFYHLPKSSIPYNLVIVDEVSMVPKTLLNLLMRHPVHVICLGDPFQLPQIDPDEDHGLLQHPHIFLDEIMRQEQESEIIRLSMDIREGKDISLFNGKEVKVFDKNELNEGMLTWADQILVGTNKMRMGINNQMRDLLGRSGGPQDGDKVICLRNYWDYIANNGDALVNGTIGIIHNSYNTFNQVPRWCGGQRFDVLDAEFISDSDANFGSLQMDKKMILTGEKCCDMKTAYRISKSEATRHLLPLEFTYGYAITCHRSQGSEWDNVLVIEERFPFEKTEHARWLYTACTRAAKRLVLIRK